ncbi:MULTISPECIES: PTS sugar transporter subunit IIA [Enterococcus]|uniref:PTS fructose transporter subunit IIA n=1 Tax=Enterococcus mundtii TaxID=53346 RepID=A0A2S7RX85_ENTMU|nr:MULTISPECIES: PTS sugar transporter subunit IIA [Enterococcus]PQF24657.1 PTS fructose transporter subunit IIA [Enterococcus mundtii]PWF37767.1 PTS fructose transporter subunit IIA [Enterococcus faecium]
MIGILVTGHGEFPSGISSTVKMFFEDTTGYRYVDFKEGMNLMAYQDMVIEQIRELKKENSAVLIITDLFGGTPFNQAMMVAQEENYVDVITGLCLPVLMEAMMLRESATNTKDLIASLQETFITSFIDGNNLLNK